jgi:hypothetical protein
MSQAEKKLYLLEKIRGCVAATHDSGYVSFVWGIEVAPSVNHNECCVVYA